MSEKKQFRNFEFILYPESMLEDAFKKISDMRIPCYVSPLHDKDKDDNGEFKKEHYHVVFTYSGNKNPDNIRMIIDSLGGVAKPGLGFVVQDKKTILRYLCHLDNPDKYQYNPTEVTTYGAVESYYECMNLSKDNLKVLIEILNFLRTDEGRSIKSIKNLTYYSIDSNNIHWLKFICYKCTYFFERFLKGL